MDWLHPLPIVTAVAPFVVALLRRRPWLALLGLASFEAGYLAVLLDQERGANSQWHLLWLIGLVILGLGLVPAAAPDSWWDRRYGSRSASAGVAAATPTIVLVLTFVVPFLLSPPEGPPEGIVRLQVVAMVILFWVVVVAPVIGWIMGLTTKSPWWRSFAVMSGALGLGVVGVVLAYWAGAFVFGF